MGTYADKVFEKINKKTSSGIGIGTYADRVFKKLDQESNQKQQNNSQTVQHPNSDLHRTNANNQSKSTLGDKVSAAGDSAYAGLTGINANIMGAVKAVDDFVWGDLFQRSDYRPLKPIYDYYLKENERAQAEKQSEIENGNLNPYVDALVSGTVQAVPTAVLGAMSGGTSLAGQAATAGANLSTAQLAANTAKDIVKNPNFIYSAVQTFGGTYEEAKQNGADTNTAIRSALLNAIPQSLIEVSGGTEKLVSKLANKTKGLTGDVFKSALEEGLEEVLQYPVEGIVKKSTYAPETPIFSTEKSAVINPKEMAQNFAVGASVGGLLGGASAGTSKVFNTVAENNAKKQQALQQEQLENRAAIAQAMKMGIVQDISGKYNYSRIGSDGTVRIYSDVFQNVEPEKQRSFIKQYAQDNYITQFDNTGNIVGEDKGITIKSDNSRVYITGQGINEISKKIRGGKNEPFLNSILELPAIIENSVLVQKDIPDEKGRPFLWNLYQSKIYINKKPYTVSLKIKNPPTGGNRYYYHTIDEIKIESEPSHGTLATDNQSLPYLFSDYPDSNKSRFRHPIGTESRTGLYAQGDRTEALSNPTIPQEPSGVKNSIRENTENMTENRQIRVSEEDVQALASAAEKAGVKVELKDLGRFNGKYKDGVIYISPYSKKPALQVFKHELTHHLESSNYYSSLEKYVLRKLTKIYGKEYMSTMVNSTMSEYSKNGIELSESEARREIVADFVADELFQSEKSIQDLVQSDRSLGEQILHWIKYKIKQFSSGDPNERFLMKAERMYEKALKTSYKREGKSKYSFGGENAKTANISTLNDAKSRIANGEDSETVRQETGWFKGYDGKWRFEIDDSQAEFRPDGDVRLMQDESYRRLQELTEKWADDDLTEAESEEMDWLDEQFSDRVWEEKYRLDDYLDHPKLYEAYPMLRFTSLVFDDLPLGEKGFYNPKSNTIVLSRDLFGKQKNTLLHEIQHIIQKYEGFAKGSSPKYWSERIESGYSKIDENGIELMPSDLYRSTAGEIEARDVSNRLDYTSEQRKSTRPDIDRTDVVFADESSTSMEIVTLDNGKQYVRASESKVIKGTDTTQWSKQIADYINNEIRKWNDFKIQTVEGDILTITRDTAYKAGSRNQIKNPDGTYRPMSDAEYLTKLNAEVHINELSEISKKINKPNAPDTKKHRFAKNGFSYRTAYFQDYDGKYYKITLSVGENGNVSTVYNVGKINKDTLPNGKIKTVLSGSKANSVSDDTTVPQKAQDVNTSISNSQKNDTGKAKYYLSDSNDVPLEQRVSGDNLLDAQDLIDTVKDVGAKVDENGYITVYHRTNNQSKEKILSSGRMTAKEDGIFFSTKRDGQNSGYGSEIISFKIPAEKLMLDDIFDDEAHLRLPLKRAGEIINVKPYLMNDTGKEQFSLSDASELSQEPKYMQEYESKLSEKNSKAASPLDNPETNKLINDPDAPTFGKRSGFTKSFALRIKNASFQGIKDIWRAMDSFAGQDSELRKYLDEKILKPLEKAKARYAFTSRDKARQFKSDMDRLGIKAGSQESAAIMWIGEGKKQVGVKKNENGFIEAKTEPYTLDMLKKDFPNTWENILEAEKLIRSMYDDYVDRINTMLEKVYPDAGKHELDILDNRKKALANAEMKIHVYSILEEKLSQQISSKKSELARKKNHNTQVYANLQIQIHNAEQKLEKAKKKLAETKKIKEEASKKLAEQQSLIDRKEHLKNKRLIPRKDYFYHMQEMETGFSALKNIIGGNFEIDPALVSISEDTKPKSKWTSFMQHRGNGKYLEDAVTGMVEYMKLAEAKIEIDPVAAYYRDVVTDVANQTQQSKNANAFIDYMTQYTNGLLGKTNRMDRLLQNETGRKAMKIITWITNRVKANAVVGNLSSAISQFFNYQNVAGYIKNPVDLAVGEAQHLRYFAQSLLNKKNIQDNDIALLLDSSPFLTERYLSNEFDVFDKSKFKTVHKFTSALLEFGDKWVAQSGWIAAYRQGLRKNVSDPVSYADNIIRRAVGGRGVGELSLHQQSIMVKTFAPFTVEVWNSWNMMVEQTKNKDFAGLIITMVVAFLMNSITKALFGKTPSADPIGAVKDGITKALDPENDKNAFEKMLGVTGRLSGELLQNMPYANFILPILIADEDSREDIFGESDPSRYGTGNIGLNMVTQPIADLASGNNVSLLEPALNIVLPGGGAQAYRTYQAAIDLGLPYLKVNASDGISLDQREFPSSVTDKGRYRFSIDTSDPLDVASALAFGSYSTKGGKAYLESGAKSLSKEATQKMIEANEDGTLSSAQFIQYYAFKQTAKADKDKNGKSIPGSLKKKKIDFLVKTFGFSKKQAENTIKNIG